MSRKALRNISLRAAFGGAVALAVAGAVLFPAGVSAYDFRLVPSVGAREEYNSNLFFSQTNREDARLLTVSPGVEAAWKTERADAALSGTAFWMRYDTESDLDLDTTDYAARGRLAYRLSPEFRLSGTGEYRRESRPDRHFEEAGLVDRSRDYRQKYAFQAECDVTEKASANLSYGFERLDYPALPQRDAAVHSAGLGFIYNLSGFSAQTQGRVNAGFSRGAYEGITIGNYTLTVGLFRAVHELWSVAANAGGMYTRSEFDVPGGRRTTDSTGASGDASLIYTGERASASLTFSHGLSPAFGYSGAAVRTAAVVNLERRFLYDVSATLTTGYYLNRSDAGQYSSQQIDERSTRLRPGVRWKATKILLFDAAYQFTWLENRISGVRVPQNVVFAGINLAYPFFDE